MERGIVDVIINTHVKKNLCFCLVPVRKKIILLPGNDSGDHTVEIFI